MRTLRLCVGEIAAGLGLLAIAYMYLHTKHASGIIAAPFLEIVLVLAYMLVAGVAQALTASKLQIVGSAILGLNLIVAAILSFLWCTGIASVGFVLVLAAATVVFRLFVAAISLRFPKQSVRRLVSALVGASFLFAGFGLAYVFGDNIYENYFLFPRTKEGFVMPSRWQDFVFLFGAAAGSIVLVFTAYRLLKYAFRIKSVPTAESA
jgi:hypothetical protein